MEAQATFDFADFERSLKVKLLRDEAYGFALERHGLSIHNQKEALNSILKDKKDFMKGVYASEAKIFFSMALDTVASKADTNKDHNTTVAEAYNLALRVNHDAEAWVLEQSYNAEPEIIVEVLEKFEEDRRQFAKAAENYQGDYGPLVKTEILRCNLAHNIDALDTVDSLNKNTQDNVIAVSTLAALHLTSIADLLGGLFFKESEQCAALSIVTEGEDSGHGLPSSTQNPAPIVGRITL